jgi:hypothetical protein
LERSAAARSSEGCSHFGDSARVSAFWNRTLAGLRIGTASNCSWKSLKW